MPTAFDENGRPVLIVYNEQGEPIRADAKAPANARLAAAREEMTGLATAQAEQTRGGSPEEAQARMEAVLRPEGGGAPQAQPYMGPQTTNLPQAATHLNVASALALGVPALVRNPVATGKALLGGIAGSTLGKEAGEWLGARVPVIGGPTTEKVLGVAGGLVGGGVGATTAPKVSGRQLLNLATGGRFGSMLGAAETRAAAPLTEEAKRRIAHEAERLAFQRRKLELDEKKFAWRVEKQAGGGGRPANAPAPTRESTAKAPEAAPAAATAGATATNEEIIAKIVQWKTVNKWSGAQIESALRNVYGISPKDGRKIIELAMKAHGAPSPLQAPRIEIGAQRVGRQVGMTKEEVRQAAGPVLGEERGEASPILPREALKNIIDTMKAMPMAEREAYVARATSGKAQWQIENIRRTLEHLGLLLPLGVAAGAARE